MATRDLEPFNWKPGQSGNPAGRPKKPRRGFNAVQRLESFGVDPLAEVITLARDASLPKATRLKAWMALMDYAYPKLRSLALNTDGEQAHDMQAELLDLIKGSSGGSEANGEGDTEN